MSENSSQNGRRSRERAAPDPTSHGTAVITGASSGIGAVYADRLAHRGFDLILVARHRERLATLAARLAEETGRSVRVRVADLSDSLDLAGIEQMLRTDPSISMLVNNAGIGSTAALIDADVETMARMIDLNVTALVRLTAEIVPAFVERGGGTIVNIGSAVAIWPELLNGVYGGTKAFVLAFSRSLHKELAERGVRVQAVLPGATDTGLWDVAGASLDRFPEGSVMSADDLVDAALAGLDQGELVTIPSLPDAAEWDAYEAARQQMLPKLSRRAPATRYGIQRPSTLPR